MYSGVKELSVIHTDLNIKDLLSLALWYRLEIQLQQNQIMDLFVDDCRALSDEDWITGTNSGTHLKVLFKGTNHTPCIYKYVGELRNITLHLCV